MRRYEILLPLLFNDGQPIPERLIKDVIVSIRTRFGAVSFETQTIRGIWQSDGVVYRDDLGRLFANVPDTRENREWFIQFKERLKVDFKQLDIWMVSHLIEVL